MEALHRALLFSAVNHPLTMAAVLLESTRS